MRLVSLVSKGRETRRNGNAKEQRIFEILRPANEFETGRSGRDRKSPAFVRLWRERLLINRSKKGNGEREKPFPSRGRSSADRLSRLQERAGQVSCPKAARKCDEPIFRASHSRGLSLSTIDSNQRRRDAALSPMTDDEARSAQLSAPLRRSSFPLSVHARAITCFTVNVKCIAYICAVSGHSG